jgi:D-lyxose ketol-isomerase
MKLSEVQRLRSKSLQLLKKAGITLTKDERANIEIADVGLGDIHHVGLEVVTYENNDKYCAKELVLFPHQFFPEHRHPRLSKTNPGKQETFRCRYGKVYLYVPGTPAAKPKAIIPPQYKQFLTVWHEVVLRPGEQYTMPPDTLHWFQAAGTGAVVSEFSTASVDEKDFFSDPHITRLPIYEQG